MLNKFLHKVNDLIGEPANDAGKNDLVFVGFTNGYQILYATETEGGEGSFFANTDNECYIPLFMLKSHAHRVETTTDMSVTLEMVESSR